MSILPLPADMRTRATEVLRRPVAMNSSVSAIRKFSFCDLHGPRLLCRVRMRLAAINLDLAINRTPQAIVRDHSANRALDQQFRMTRAPCADALGFMTTDETGKAHVSLLLFLFAAHAHLPGVYHNHEVT